MYVMSHVLLYIMYMSIHVYVPRVAFRKWIMAGQNESRNYFGGGLTSAVCTRGVRGHVPPGKFLK